EALTRSFCGRVLQANRFIASTDLSRLRIFLSSDMALFEGAEFDFLFVALHNSDLIHGFGSASNGQTQISTVSRNDYGVPLCLLLTSSSLSSPLRLTSSRQRSTSFAISRSSSTWPE